MTRILTLALVLLSATALPLPASAALFDTHKTTDFLPVEEAFQPSAEVKPGQVILRWTVTPGYYLYNKRFHVEWAKDQGAMPTLPTPSVDLPGELIQDPNFGQVKIYRQDVTLTLPLKIDARSFPDTALLSVHYQGCAAAGLCYPPQTWTVNVDKADLLAGTDVTQAKLSLNPPGAVGQPSPAHPAEATTATPSFDGENADSLAKWLAHASLPVILGTFLLLGLGLAFTPCVLPMLPILSAIIAGQKTPTSRQGFLLALSYVLGMSLMYTLAGLLIATLGAAANLSNLLQKPVVLIVFAAFFVVLAWLLASGRDLRLPSGLQDKLSGMQNRQAGGAYGSVFLMGAISSLVLSPCVSAPLAGILIYLGAQGDAFLGASALFCLSLGMGAPLLLLGAGGGRWLPRSGPWLDASKQFFAWMLLAVAVSLINRLLPANQQLLLWAAFFALAAVTMVSTVLWRKAAALVLMAWAGLLIWGSAQGHTDALRPWIGTNAGGAAAATHASTEAMVTITDPAQLQPAIAAATAQGKPVMIDVYADWCISCVAMQRDVLSKPEVQAVMARGVIIRFDITATTGPQLDWVQQQKLFGPPAMLFWSAKGQASGRLVGEANQTKFLEALNTAWN